MENDKKGIFVAVDSEPKATATDLSERCGRIEQRYVGQSGQSDGVKGSKTHFRTATLR